MALGLESNGRSIAVFSDGFSDAMLYVNVEGVYGECHSSQRATDEDDSEGCAFLSLVIGNPQVAH